MSNKNQNVAGSAQALADTENSTSPFVVGESLRNAKWAPGTLHMVTLHLGSTELVLTNLTEMTQDEGWQSVLAMLAHIIADQRVMAGLVKNNLDIQLKVD